MARFGHLRRSCKKKKNEKIIGKIPRTRIVSFVGRDRREALGTKRKPRKLSHVAL